MVATNSINLTTGGIVGYDGAGNFTATGVTTANVLIGGGSNDTLVNVAPPNNIGTPLISNGTTGTNPVFGTCEPRGGGTGLSALVAYELMAGGTTTTNPMQQIGTGTSGQVLISGGSTALPSFQTISGVVKWSDQATSFNIVAGNGYFCTAALTAALPLAANEGDTVTIYCDTGSSVIIQANTGQFIRNNSSISSSNGTATSSTQGNSITLVYRAASSTWYSTSVEGTWVVV